MCAIMYDNNEPPYKKRYWLLNKFISLFCKHDYKFHRNIHGEEINNLNGKRSWWYCPKCGKFKPKNKYV